MRVETNIREQYKINKVSQKKLSVMFDTSPAQVSRIINNKIWKIPEEL